MLEPILYTQKPANILQRYDQKSTPNCLFYAFAGCLAWNTWDIMTEEAVNKLADRIKPWQPVQKMPLIADYVKAYYTMHAIRTDWTPILKKWWWILVHLKAEKDFWIDVSDGKLDEKAFVEDGGNHEGWIHQVDGKIIFENSWKNLPSFEITGKINELRNNWVMPWMWYIFTNK